MILRLRIADIKIPDYRQRKDFDGEELAKLMDSISKNGLLHPIVVRGGDTLVAGERRLRAISNLVGTGDQLRFGGADWEPGFIPAVDIGTLDPLAAEEAEYEENVCRRDYTWQEKAAATDRLADLRRRQAESLGQPLPTVADIAIEVTGRGDAWYRDETRRELIVAKHLTSNPEVAKAKTVREAFEILKRQETATRNKALSETVGKTFSSASHTLVRANCLEWMKSQQKEQFDVICTDPPYGIDAQSFGDADGRLQTQTHLYDDSYESWRVLIAACSVEWFRLAKPEAHLYCCCDIDRFAELKEILSVDGWQVHRTPLVNYKRDGSRVPWPYWGPQRKWELVLYAMKGKKSVTRIYPDVIETSGDENLGHGAQKPVALFLDLLRRSVRPGDSVLDTFAGTGTVVAAAHALQCTATAIEQDENYYGIAVKRLQELK